jgi:hypothetical protein
MTTNEGRRAALDVKPRDPLRMINGEGIITATVVSATAIAATAGPSSRGADKMESAQAEPR